MQSPQIFMARVPKEIFLIVWDEETMECGTKEDADDAQNSLNPPAFIVSYSLQAASMPKPSTN